MENDTQLMAMEPHEIKMESCPDAREYRLVNGRLVATSDCDAGDEELTTDETGCIIPQFDSESDLAMLPGLNSQADVMNSVYSENSHELNHSSDPGEDSTDANDIILIQLMDIRTSLSKLKVMLEQRKGLDLSDYEFWLQNSKMLESHKTLVDQCIKGEGVVQVNVQIKHDCQRINIMDVLKPDEEYLDMADEINSRSADATSNGDATDYLEPSDTNIEQDTENLRISDEGNNSRSNSPVNSSTMVKWTVDLQFKADQLRLHIPEDPNFWTVPQVRHWIQWAVRQFNLTGIKLFDWSISGNELCALTLQEFKKKCPSDPGDLFWTHLELLRKCKFIAVVQNENNMADIVQDNTSPSAIRKKPKASPILMDKSSPTVSLMSAGIHRAGNNGQIQLWQFLLELLTSTEHKTIIQWIGANGEFKLQDPELVAKLWGLRKHKPTMNYEKLSRALRYYYDGDMISKVPGKRFVYSFVCDLKQLIGYNAAELSGLVNEGLNNSSADDTNSYEMCW